jgi:hypothetical protein
MVRPIPVAHFNVQTYTTSYHTYFDDTLSMVLDPSVRDHFLVEDMNFRSMEVHDFRKSLRLSLYYTFADSFREVRFTHEPVEEGITLQIFRIRPGWKIQNVEEDFDGYDSSSTFYLSSLIRYDGLILRNGRKMKIIDDEAVSEKVVTRMHWWHEAFVDGVREMCEQLYRSMAEEHKVLSRK